MMTMTRKRPCEDDQDSMITNILYKASREGSVVTLNELLQNDPTFLSKVSVTTFSKTPLHISAMLGHSDFSKQLLAKEPKLAAYVDLLGRSPLHLASAEGHVEVVQALLHAHKGMCVAKDHDGKTPLHHAAERGHVDVVELLVDAEPRSVSVTLPDGETVLHLCVRYNHLEALKVLVKLAGLFDNLAFLNSEDFINAKEGRGGNTILHLAVLLKQVETVKYLLSESKVKVETPNRNDRKASELVDDRDNASDLNSLELKLILTPGKESRWHRWTVKPLENLHNAARQWLKSEQMQGSIMVVASLIAQMTFQSAVSPPGGVWEESRNSTDISLPGGGTACSAERPCYAGSAVLADVSPYQYLRLTKYNSMAFLSSLSVILLVAGGLPLSNSFNVWLMTIAMLFTLTFTALTYMESLTLVSTSDVADYMYNIYDVFIWIWVGLLTLIGVCHTVFIIMCLINKLKQRRNRGASAAGDKHSGPSAQRGRRGVLPTTSRNAI